MAQFNRRFIIKGEIWELRYDTITGDLKILAKRMSSRQSLDLLEVVELFKAVVMSLCNEIEELESKFERVQELRNKGDA